MTQNNLLQLNKAIEEKEALIQQLEKEKAESNDFGYNFDSLQIVRHEYSGKLSHLKKVKKSVAGSSFYCSVIEHYFLTFDEILAFTETDDFLKEVSNYSTAIYEYKRKWDLSKQIIRLNKQLLHLKKCKNESIVTDKRAAIRHNIKNNLYRKSDEGDHAVIHNLNLHLTNYGYTFSYYHHDTTTYNTADRKDPNRDRFRRVKFMRERPAAFGVC